MSQWDAGGTKNSQRSALFSRMHASEGKGNYWLSSPQVFPESQEHRFLRFATSNMLLTAPPSDSVWPFGFSNVSGKAYNWNKEEMEPYPTHQSLRMTWGEKQRKKCRTLVSAKRNGSAWEHNDSMSPFLGPETQYVGHALLHPIARRKTQRGPPAQKKRYHLRVLFILILRGRGLWHAHLDTIHLSLISCVGPSDDWTYQVLMKHVSTLASDVAGSGDVCETIWHGLVLLNLKTR